MDRSGFFKNLKLTMSLGFSRSIRMQILWPALGSKVVLRSRVRLKGGNIRAETCSDILIAIKI